MRVTIKIPPVEQFERIRDLILLAHHWADLAVGMEDDLPKKVNVKYIFILIIIG